MRCPLALHLLAVCCFVSTSRTASAQSGGDSLAETLFQEARQSMQRGDFVGACPKLEQSQRLDPRGGTLLNLALCHEKQGELSAAFREYLEAGQIAEREGNHERLEFARVHAEALRPRLTIFVQPVRGEAAPEVMLDGTPLDSAALGAPIALEPGRHLIAARAQGRRPWQTALELRPGAPSVVTVPVLSRLEQPGRVEHSRAPLELYVAGAAGAAFLTTSVVTAVLAHDRAQDFERINADPAYTTAQRSDARGRARTMQYWNAGFIGATVIAAGAAVFFYLQRPGDQVARLTPWLLAKGGGLGFSGALD